MTFPYMYVVLLIIFTPVIPLPLPALLSPQNFFFFFFCCVASFKMLLNQGLFGSEVSLLTHHSGHTRAVYESGLGSDELSILPPLLVPWLPEQREQGAGHA